MKKILFFIVACVSVLYSAAGDATVKMKYANETFKGAEVELTWFLSSSNCKMELHFTNKDATTVSAFIPDNNNLLMYDVKADGKNKLIYTLPLESLKSDPRLTFKRSKAVVKEETRRIAGVECKKVVFTTDKFVSEFWVAASLPDATKWQQYFLSYPELAAVAEAELSGFPLASVIKDLSGNIVSSFEATSVSFDALAKDVFLPPSGYSKIEPSATK